MPRAHAADESRGAQESLLAMTDEADHAEDIVMFDVPPPHDGVRGIDAYRETWPPFFEWQAHGASFEIVSLDVADAHALLRCGSREELEAHEHHSFANES
jgi:ketosteroid isomerase-like protein